MKTLWLLRHAKASAGGDGLADRDRPLSARGRAAADAIGRHLAERGVRPELVLCSSALRTRETCELMGKAIGGAWPVEYETELYLASALDLRERIARVPDVAGSLLVVGHNPGIAELALELARRGDSEALAALRRKVPTGALAELRVHAPGWRAIARTCELASFVTPKQLVP